MMNDEQFETIMQQLENHGGRYSMLVLKLRARDTAQREALARMEAEAGRLAEAGLAAHVRATTAQAQLADILYILDQHRAWTGMGWEQLPVPVHAVEKIRSKLAQAEQQEAPIPEYFQEACDKFDWTPEEALRFYAEGKHFDTDRGRTRILDTGAIASNALKHASLPYLEMKGDAELSEFRAAVGAKQEAQGAQAGDERAAFEEWAAVEFGYVVTGHWNGSRYVDGEVQQEWTKWQARAALATQPADQYRKLRTGDIIQATDELMMDDCVTWKPIGADNQLCVGMTWREGFTAIRRKEAAVRGAEHDQ